MTERCNVFLLVIECLLTDDSLAFDAIACVVVGTRYGGQFAVGRCDVSEFVAQSAALVQSATGST